MDMFLPIFNNAMPIFEHRATHALYILEVMPVFLFEPVKAWLINFFDLKHYY